MNILKSKVINSVMITKEDSIHIAYLELERVFEKGSPNEIIILPFK